MTDTPEAIPIRYRVRRVKGLGEVSIHVKDLGAIHKFYEEVVGLEVLC